MLRLLIIFATLLFLTPCASVSAQLFGRSWNRGGHHGGSQQAQHYRNRHRGNGVSTFGGSGFGRYGSSSYRGDRSSFPSTIFGLSFGTTPYGYDYAGYPDPYFTYPYSYDPWSRGSFRAPDLLDDPYFYDRVPSANRSSSRRIQRPMVPSMAVPSMTVPSTIAPSTTYRSNSEFGSYAYGGSVLVTPMPATGNVAVASLQSASDRLLQSLASSGGGDAWIEYLAPDQINELADQGNTTKLRELMARFDGVGENRQLQVVAQLDGFAETRDQLRQHLREPYEAIAPPIDEPAFESLPPPQPEPVLESPAND